MRKKQFILGTTSGGGCSGADWSIVNSLLFRVKGGGGFFGGRGGSEIRGEGWWYRTSVISNTQTADDADTHFWRHDKWMEILQHNSRENDDTEYLTNMGQVQFFSILAQLFLCTIRKYIHKFVWGRHSGSRNSSTETIAYYGWSGEH